MTAEFSEGPNKLEVAKSFLNLLHPTTLQSTKCSKAGLKNINYYVVYYAITTCVFTRQLFFIFQITKNGYFCILYSSPKMELIGHIVISFEWNEECAPDMLKAK